MMSNTHLPHISEDVLELYAMGRLSEPETEPVEEHLLVCSVCQDALQQTDEFVRAIRVAARELQSEPEPVAVPLNVPVSQPKADPWWKKLFAMPAPMLGVAACAVLALIMLVPRERPGATVELRAMRGPETAATAPSSAPLTLNLSLAGLDNPGALRIEVADEVGNIVRRADAPRSGEGAIAKADALKAGTYWVRLYSGNELLREYGLSVR